MSNSTAVCYKPAVEPFRYESLQANQIRLLKLIPGEDCDELECSLYTISLNDAPEYEAMSYCWGDPDPATYIWCEGRRIRITLNLFKGLAQVRYRQQSRVLWADQICINQEDILERSAQVHAMGQIFKSAQLVIAWLGPDDSGTELQAPLAMEIVQKMDAFTEAGYPRLIVEDGDLAKFGMPPFTSPAWSPFRAFVQIDYFSRAWILQEISLAATTVMLWGPTVIDVERVLDIVSTMHLFNRQGLKIGSAESGAFLQTMASGSKTQRRTMERSLASIFNRMSGRKAKDPRDLIFATLGMLDHPQSIVYADYSKSLVDVATGAARIFLQEDPYDLEFLSYAACQWSAVNELDETWPSWVPQ